MVINVLFLKHKKNSQKRLYTLFLLGFWGKLYCYSIVSFVLRGI